MRRPYDDADAGEQQREHGDVLEAAVHRPHPDDEDQPEHD